MAERKPWEEMLQAALTGGVQGYSSAMSKRNALDSETEKAIMLGRIKNTMQQENRSNTITRLGGSGNLRLGGIDASGNPTYKVMSPLDLQKEKDLLAQNKTDTLTTPTTPDEKQNFLNQLPARDAALVEGITNYNYDIYRGLSFKDRERIGGLATMYDPSFSMADFNARQNYKNEFAKGKIGANIRSYNTVLGHLGSLNDAVSNPALPSSGVAAVEAAKRAVSKGLFARSPSALAIASEDASLNAVAGELATVFKNTSGTDQEINKWLQSYSKNAPKEYKQQWIKEGVGLVQSRMGAIGYDYERVMGKPYDKSLTSSKAEQVLNKILIKNTTYNKGDTRTIGGNNYIRNESGQWIKS